MISNTGTWMQTVVLPAYIDRRTESGAWVGAFVFAMLGPVLVLSVPGGVLADRFPRRSWLMATQGLQMAMTVAIALLVAGDAPLGWILAAQTATGIGNALNNPALQGIMPNMVDPADIGGMVSLNSVGINGSRVIGPIIAAVLMANGFSTSQVLLVNAASYLVAIGSIRVVRFPPREQATESTGWANVLHGVRLARQRSILGRMIAGMAVFSFFCLPFVGLFPAITRIAFGLDSSTSTYKWLYATWGFGALLGALALGTVLSRMDKTTLIRPLLLGFAATLAVFSLLRSTAAAFPVGFGLGFCYFAMATSMVTVVQHNLRSFERARVMALWFMAFGGTVSLGNLTFGPVLDAIGPRPVLWMGVVAAVGLSEWCDIPRRRLRTLAQEDPSAGDQGVGHPLQTGDPTGLDQHGVVGGD